MSDTVGFIRDLPHGLIASFKATLEEARQADLLLHVADAANPAVLDQISAVYEVLQELGIEEKDTLLVLNKIDRLADRGQLEPVLQRYPNAVPISAQHARRPRPAARRGERRPEPVVCRPGRRNERRQRPAAGLPGGARRGPRAGDTTTTG